MEADSQGHSTQAARQHADAGPQASEAPAGSASVLPESCLLVESGDLLGNSIHTSQLIFRGRRHQGSEHFGLLPETEPEDFSQGVTGSLSVAQPLRHTQAAASQDEQQVQQRSQQHEPAAGAGRAAGNVPDWDDEVDDLLREQEEMQEQEQDQQQQRPAPAQQQKQQKRAVPAWDDDEFDYLLQEQEEMQQYERQQQQQPWGYPLDDPDMFDDMPQQQQQQQQAGKSGAGQQGRAAGQSGVGDAADLDAELEDLLNETAAAQGAGRTAAAAAAAGDEELDFGDELDAMFGAQGAGDGTAGPYTSSQAMPPPPPKPTAIASLGVGGAAAASRKAAAAAALAALQAAARPPKQLASELTGPAITVTGMTGARVYCQLAQQTAAEAAAGQGGSRSRGLAAGGSRGGLLQQPIDELLDMLANRRRQEVIAEVEAAQAAADRADAAARDDAPDDAGDSLEQQQEQEQHEVKQEQQEQQAAAAAAAVAAATPRQLWVDKYAPKSFLALLSEPRVNREIAAWMARWNKQTQQHTSHHQQPHKQQLPQQQQQPQQQGGRGGAGRGRGAGGPGVAGGRGGGKGSGGRGDGSGARQGGISRRFDAARYKALQEARAAARVLLVVGPPGTGKTTLAHVIARHCGFRVVEVNASDARTATNLTRAVTDAAEMAPVLDSSRRRPCIVLDELDGAAGGAENHSAVAALVKLLTGEGRSKKRKRGAKGPAGPSGGLSVPVICTANDAYAPCLRPLRDIAAVYHFKPPAPDKLSARLAAIAAAEGLSLDKQALSMLVEHSGCDMRTAINTLQLLARQHAPQHHASTQAPGSGTQQGSSQRRAQRVRITAADIQSKGAFGVKDVAHTPLNVVQDMLASSSSRSMAARLQQLAAAMKAEQQGAAAAGSSRGGRRSSRGAMPAATLSAAAAARLALQEHYSMLLDLGEHEQVLSVLHESLPDLVGLDVDLATTTAAMEAMASADLLMASGRGGSGSSSWQYVPATLLTTVGLTRRDTSGIGVMGSAGISLAWPRAQAECSRNSTTVRALLRSWRASSPAHAARALGSSSDALLELAPALRDISRPAAVRAVNAQLLSRDEEQVLTHVTDALVAYGLTYAFPVEDEADDARTPRPAPLAPSIDTLHTYSALPQPVARFLGDKRAMKPGWAKGMPLMMRQLLAQRISTAVITRLERARHAGGEHAGSQDGPTPSKAAAAAGRTPFAPTGQQQAASGSKSSGPAGNSGKAPAKPPSKPAPLPKAPKGCWLDAARGQAAAKRKAQILAVGANKRAALGQGPRATAAAGDGTEDAAAAEGTGDGAGCGHNGYTVLYKFNEGYTNAVKRPIKMAELLGLHQ